jgi:hypothetical protein
MALGTRPALALTSIVLLAGCGGAQSSQASLPGGSSAQSLVRRAVPRAHASGAPWARVGVAVSKRSRIVRRAGTVLVSESFNTISTKTWAWKDAACLTAGTASTPKHSIPACSASSPEDQPGSGALQLTPDDTYEIGMTAWPKALPTANGLDVRFDYYSYDGTSPGADGTLVFFADASMKRPGKPAGNGGALGYIEGPRHSGLKGAYLGVGLDEYGNFSAFLPGGPGFVPETVALGGAESNGYAYLGGVTDASGVPASLPFDLNQSSATMRPSNAPRVDIQLTSDGTLEVAFDIHDGNGFVTYLTESIVGVAGQPAVPAKVFVGFIGSTGGLSDRHEMANLTISTLQ